MIERFANPAIRDQLARIGSDGSVRIPKFILPSVAEQLRRGGPMDRLCFTVASWFRCLSRTSDTGRPLPISDPLEAALRERARAGGNDPGPLLAMREIFSAEVAEHPAFREQVGRWLRSLQDEGARATLEKLAVGGR